MHGLPGCRLGAMLAVYDIAMSGTDEVKQEGIRILKSMQVENWDLRFFNPLVSRFLSTFPPMRFMNHFLGRTVGQQIIDRIERSMG